jgi:hypothetical protein
MIEKIYSTMEAEEYYEIQEQVNTIAGPRYILFYRTYCWQDAETLFNKTKKEHPEKKIRLVQIVKKEEIITQ